MDSKVELTINVRGSCDNRGYRGLLGSYIHTLLGGDTVIQEVGFSPGASVEARSVIVRFYYTLLSSCLVTPGN